MKREPIMGPARRRILNNRQALESRVLWLKIGLTAKAGRARSGPLANFAPSR